MGVDEPAVGVDAAVVSGTLTLRALDSSDARVSRAISSSRI
jgi:hypothetical protein